MRPAAGRTRGSCHVLVFTLPSTSLHFDIRHQFKSAPTTTIIKTSQQYHESAILINLKLSLLNAHQSYDAPESYPIAAHKVTSAYFNIWLARPSPGQKVSAARRRAGHVRAGFPSPPRPCRPQACRLGQRHSPGHWHSRPSVLLVSRSSSD